MALAATARGDAPAGPAALPATCLACHGGGQSSAANTPSLGAQPPGYSLVQLFLFREKLRLFEPMNLVAQGLSDEDLKRFADAIAALPKPVPPSAPADAQRLQRAQSLAVAQHCASCHNADFSGHDNIPRLAGQREEYLAGSMREYKDNSRSGYDGTMSEVMQAVPDEGIADLAYYLAHFPACDPACQETR